MQQIVSKTLSTDNKNGLVFRWSPDSHFLACAARNKVNIYNRDGSVKHVMNLEGKYTVQNLEWSQDRKTPLILAVLQYGSDSVVIWRSKNNTVEPVSAFLPHVLCVPSDFLCILWSYVLKVYHRPIYDVL